VMLTAQPTISPQLPSIIVKDDTTIYEVKESCCPMVIASPSPSTSDSPVDELFGQKKFLYIALQLAVDNFKNGGKACGTVVIQNGVVIATAANTEHLTNDPTAHDGINAIRAACVKLQSNVLTGCDIYCSYHPCPMCLAAISLAKPNRLFYSYTTTDSDAVQSTLPTYRIIDDTGLAPEAFSPMSKSLSGAKLLEDQFITLELTTPTQDMIEGYGTLIAPLSLDCNQISIPFYKGSVKEGKNYDFECTPPAVCRSAQISKREVSEVVWLERHVRMTQLFMGLGNSPYIMVLGKPTENNLPDLSSVRAFLFPSGTGVILQKGTWHDFPMSAGPTVSVLTFNSAEVVEALTSMSAPMEMDFGDVFKVNVLDRLHIRLKVNV